MQSTLLQCQALDHFLSVADPEAFSAKLDGALQRLPGLLSLLLADAPRGGPLPPSLTCLSSLRRLYVRGTDCALPGGPWSSNLRAFGASLETLVRSQAVLAAAPALGYVAVLQISKSSAAAAASFWRWVSRHPALWCLRFEGLPDNIPTSVLKDCVDLCRLRPKLIVSCHTNYPEFKHVFCFYRDFHMR